MSKRDEEYDLVVNRQSQSNFSALTFVIALFVVYLLFKFISINEFSVDSLKQLTSEITSIEKTISKKQNSNSPETNNLHQLVTNGKLDEIEQFLISDKQAINKVIKGMTPIMLAAAQGNVEIIDLLFTQGADPNKRGSMDRTALQYAVDKNHMEAAKRLLAYGAEIDDYDNGKLTPLVMAANRGYSELALFLVEEGADVNIPQIEGWTALINAAAHNDEELVKALIEAGADKEHKAKNGKTAIDYAKDYGFPNMVKILSK